jgi:arylsulfatase A-like enzyme
MGGSISSRRRVVPRALAIAALLVVVGRWLGPPPVIRPNVLVIGIDTLRRDRLGCYGYPRPTSPSIDGLARDGVVFEQAISQAPWTMPAFASIFTGLTPTRHGAGWGGMPKPRPLDAVPVTLAEVLRAAGYRTVSFVTNGWVSGTVGLGRGFEHAGLHIGQDGATKQASAWIAEHARERFFMFVHLLDPHAPYIKSDADLAALDLQATEVQVAAVNALLSGSRPLTDRSPEETALVHGLYDMSVHRADRRVGTLLDVLEANGLRDDTIVVIVSDHGEELFDHGKHGHGHTLYDELLRVPFVMRFPEGAWSQRVAPQVRTMDLMPTLLDALHIPEPPDLDGVSLMPLLRGDARAMVPAVAPAEFIAHGPEVKALRRPDAKLLLVPATGRLLSYDLVADPQERARLEGPQGGAATLQPELERTFTTRLDGMLFTAFGWAEDHDVGLVLEAATPFQEAALLSAEATDTLVRSPDGRRIEVHLHLPATYTQQSVDLDAVRIRTHDGETVTVTATLDGAPMPRKNVRLGRQRREPLRRGPWRFTADNLLLVVPPGYPAVPDQGFALTITSRIDPGAPAPLPERVEKQLRHLGYLE